MCPFFASSSSLPYCHLFAVGCSKFKSVKPFKLMITLTTYNTKYTLPKCWISFMPSYFLVIFCSLHYFVVGCGHIIYILHPLLPYHHFAESSWSLCMAYWMWNMKDLFQLFLMSPVKGSHCKMEYIQLPFKFRITIIIIWSAKYFHQTCMFHVPVHCGLCTFCT